MISHIDAWYAQGNILITREGQACLGDFGIAGAFTYHAHKPRNRRYTAPEEFWGYYPLLGNGPPEKSDVYSLAMTSFQVRHSAADHPTT